MSQWFYGLKHLAEVGAAEIETYTPVTTELRDAVVHLLTEYLEGKIPYEICRDEIVKLTGRDEPILKVKEAMSLPETPLPPFSGSSETSPNSCRRKTHTWSSAEDLRLIAGVARFGLDNWQAVAHFLGSSRNRSQCSQRWARCLDPHISRKPWSAEEDSRLIDIVKEQGDKCWTKVASMLGGRSDVQCRYHYKHLTVSSNGPGSDNDSPISLERSGFAMSTNDLLLKPLPVLPPLESRDADSPPIKPPNPRVHPPSGPNYSNSGHISLGEGRKFGSIPIFSMSSISNITPLKSSWVGCVGSDPSSLQNFLDQFSSN